MNNHRYGEVFDDDAPLTPEEINQGWHFCCEYDGLLVGPGMGELECCECLPEPLLGQLKAALPPSPFR